MKPDRLRKARKPAQTHGAPAHLSAIARQEWARLAPMAAAAGTLLPSTERAFELLVETLATERAAVEIVARDGVVVSSAAKTSKPHPAVRTLEIARGQAIPLLRRFGLLPNGQARSKAKHEPEPEAKKPSVWSGVLS